MLTSKNQFIKNIVYRAHGHVFVHINFLNDSSALLCNLFAGQSGIKKNVADDIKRRVQISAAYFCIIGSPVFRGKSVVNTSDGIQFFAYQSRTWPFLRSLEKHVLKKVRQAVFFL